MNKQTAARFLILLIFLLGIRGATKVNAHAVPVQSSPPPNSLLERMPTKILIQFNEPVVIGLSQIQLFTQVGDRIELGPIELADESGLLLSVAVPPIDDGSYLVNWQVLSTVDGHTTSGSFSFGVGITELVGGGEEGMSVIAELSPLSAASRAVTIVGISLLIGFFLFRLFVWQPTLTFVGKEIGQIDEQFWGIGLKTSWGAILGIGVASLFSLAYQMQSYALWEGENLGIWLGTQFGQIWVARLVLTGLFAILVWDIGRRNRIRFDLIWGIGLFLLLCLALSSALISHSAAFMGESWRGVVVDFMHLLGASIWAGGLYYYLWGLLLGREVADDFSLHLTINFSAFAAAGVGVLLLSGGYLAGEHIGGWSALVGTAYGLLLLGKLGLALVAFSLAGFNSLVLKRRLKEVVGDGEKKRLSRTLRIVSGGELILGVLILLMAGVLSDLQRGKDAPMLRDLPGEMEVTQQLDELTVVLAIEPALVGANQFDLLITDQAGNPIGDDGEVEIRFTFLGRSLGSSSGLAEGVGDGVYRLDGRFISLIGVWQLEVVIREEGKFDQFAPFRLEAGLGGEIRPLDQGGRFLERVAQFMNLLGEGGTGILMLLGALVWFWLMPRIVDQKYLLVPLILLAVPPFLIGGVQIYDYLTVDFTPAKFLTNPILPDVESINEGKLLYEANCVACHGALGRADGVLVPSLAVPPADFGDGHTETHPDGDLYYWIQEGIEKSGMPAFGEQFSKEEQWHLVNYIRRLSALAQER